MNGILVNRFVYLTITLLGFVGLAHAQDAVPEEIMGCTLFIR